MTLMGNVLVVCFWSPAHRCAGLGGAFAIRAVSGGADLRESGPWDVWHPQFDALSVRDWTDARVPLNPLHHHHHQSFWGSLVHFGGAVADPFVGTLKLR